MTTDRRLALIAGLLYLATFATSFPALALKTAFISGGDASLAGWAAALEVALAATCIGTAVALYPVTRRVSESLALGFVASRTIEAGVILTGVIGLMSLVTVRGAGTTTEVDAALVAVHDWAFLLGPAFMSATNALLLGTIMYRARLVPRIIPIVGLIGAPLLLASSVGVLLGAWTQLSPIGALTALPIAAWELALGLWLVFRGVKTDRETDAAVPVASAA